MKWNVAVRVTDIVEADEAEDAVEEFQNRLMKAGFTPEFGDSDDVFESKLDA